MGKRELNRNALKLIEEAKDLSKERFLTFAENIYSTPRNNWEHLWKTPLASNYDIKSCFPEELTSLLEEYIPDFWERFAKKQLQTTEAIFLPIEKILFELTELLEEEYGDDYESIYSNLLDKYKELVNDGIISQDTSGVIIYDEEFLLETFAHNIKEAPSRTPPQTHEQVAEYFLNYVSKIFTHERVHQNTRIIVPDPSIENPNGIDYIYGIRLPNKSETQNSLDGSFDGLKLLAFEDHDEAMVEIVAQLIEKYSPGSTIEDGLSQILNNTPYTPHQPIDNKLALSLFTLFPDELTMWTMFNAQNTNYHNLFLEKHDTVFGENMTTRPEKLKGKPKASFIMNENYILDSTGSYFTEVLIPTLEPHQIEKRSNILEKLGVSNIDLSQTHSQENASPKFDFDAFLALVFSDTAMSELSGATQDIRTAKHELEHPKENKKSNDIEP